MNKINTDPGWSVVSATVAGVRVPIDVDYVVPVEVLQLLPVAGDVLLVQQGEDGYGEARLPLVGFAVVRVHIGDESRVIIEAVVQYFGRPGALSAVIKDYPRALPEITIAAGRSAVAP